ncbi:hypothetical protein [Wolbachia endosymbiont (group A) of Urophora cardui]|uniref:hypothetical protein n=1 Tax=Wolbachia endosymbiont (group A) of Urophora cardui TaxID=3066156 RepID=UPI0033409CC0
MPYENEILLKIRTCFVIVVLPDSVRLCCIATYERLTIARIISNLLKILFFCNQSDQI